MLCISDKASDWYTELCSPHTHTHTHNVLIFYLYFFNVSDILAFVHWEMCPSKKGPVSHRHINNKKDCNVGVCSCRLMEITSLDPVCRSRRSCCSSSVGFVPSVSEALPPGRRRPRGHNRCPPQWCPAPCTRSPQTPGPPSRRSGSTLQDMKEKRHVSGQDTTAAVPWRNLILFSPKGQSVWMLVSGFDVTHAHHSETKVIWQLYSLKSISISWHSVMKKLSLAVF